MIQLRFYLMLLALTAAGQIYGQLHEVYQNEQFAITRIYAGMNSTTHFPADSVAAYASANFRIGTMATFQMSEQLRFNYWGVMHFEKNEVASAFNSFAVQFTPAKKLNIQAGLVATPATILRPNPTTWQSQVETPTQQTIIPGRPGGKLSYQLTQQLWLTYGIFKHGETWMQHGSIKFQNWQLAGFGSTDGLDLLALKFVSDKFESTTTYQPQESLNMMMILRAGDKWSLLVDAHQDLEGRVAKMRQIAIRRHFYAPEAHIRSFLALSYDWRARAIVGQVFVYLF